MNKFMRSSPLSFGFKKHLGFTLIEIMIVISLVGILTVLGLSSYLNSQRQGRNSRRMTDLKVIQAALEQYYTDNGQYPDACSPGATYFPQGIPLDPKTGTSYVFNLMGGSSGCGAAPASYCSCVQLEGTNPPGNSTNATCNFASGSYYCVRNLQ